MPSNKIHQNKIYIPSSSNLNRGYAVFEKSLINLQWKPACPRKLLTPFYKDAWRKSLYNFNFCLINLYPILRDAMSLYYTFFHDTVKFSKFSSRLKSSHILRTSTKLLKQRSMQPPNTQLSSINTSIVSSTISENIDIIHIWNDVGALHYPKTILLNVNIA